MYQALYRKWRPRTFDEISGQEHITKILRMQCEENRVSHAYLFCGTRGTGKTSTAKILAKAINCDNPVNGNPCNCCYACTSIDSGTATDVLEIDAASNNGVDDIRELRDEVVYPPSVLKKRVYIIDEVHMLSSGAFNALLKTLEEPPEYIAFILATTELNKLPATIISRCIRFDFNRLSEEIIADRLRYVAKEENIPLGEGAAELLSRLADGALRDGLSILEACTSGVGEGHAVTAQSVRDRLGIADADQIVAYYSAVAAGNVPDALAVLEEIHCSSKDIGVFLEDNAAKARDMLVMQQ
ncbi:MAG: DNA polymerase III subunit gamma/tau, partial [Clostridia bacterium]|nr:DNA polymerase III subunit gamma/tau [Clostridia bacterium]